MSYGMIRILVIGSLRSPPKGETEEWYMKYMTLCFSSPYFSFPLEGKSREAGKGVRGRASKWHSIAILTANRRPVSFLLLTIGHTFGVKVHRVQKGRFLGLTGPMGRRVRKFDGAFGPEGCGGALRAQIIKKPARALPSFRPKRSGVEKSPPLMVRATLGREISRLSVSWERFPSVSHSGTQPRSR